MVNNATEFQRVYIDTRYTDLRCGIDGMASIVNMGIFEIDQQIMEGIS